MGKLNNFLTLFLFLILLSSFAYSWSPQSDMDLRDTYDLYNATNITSEGDVCISTGNCLSNISDVEILTSNYSSYSNSSSYLDNYSSSDFILSGDESNLNVNSSTWWASASSFISKWFYSNSGVLTLNETQLNISVEDVGNSTYLINNKNNSLDGSLNITEDNKICFGDSCSTYMDNSSVVVNNEELWKSADCVVDINGNGDSTTIEGCTDLGGDVFIKEGTYSLDSQIIPAENTSIICSQDSLIVGNFTGDYGIFKLTNDNINIIGCNFDLIDKTNRAIWALQNENFKILYNTIKGDYSTSSPNRVFLHLQGKHGIVIGNKIEGYSIVGEGNFTGLGIAITNYAEDIIVSKNEIYYTDDSCFSIGGGIADAAVDISVIDNICVGNISQGGYGVDIFGEAYNIQVKNNIIRGKNNTCLMAQYSTLWAPDRIFFESNLCEDIQREGAHMKINDSNGIGSIVNNRFINVGLRGDATDDCVDLEFGRNVSLRNNDCIGFEGGGVEYNLRRTPINIYTTDDGIYTTEFFGNINWTYLQNYPSACPANTFATEMGDSIICSSVGGLISNVTVIPGNWIGENVFSSFIPRESSGLNTIINSKDNFIINLDSNNNQVSTFTISGNILNSSGTPFFTVDENGDGMISNSFNATILRQNGNVVLDSSDESNLNVNSSSYWDNLNSPSDINAGDITADGTYILSSNESVLNVNSSTWWADVSSFATRWLIKTGNDLDFNESRLNATIDLRSSSDSRWTVDNVWVYNSSGDLSWNTTSGDARYYPKSSDLDLNSNSIFGANVINVTEVNLENLNVINPNAGDAIFINQSGAGSAMYLLQKANDRALEIKADVGGDYTTELFKFYINDPITTTGGLFDIYVDNDASTGNVFRARNDGSGLGILVDVNGDGAGLRIDSESTTNSSIIIDDVPSDKALEMATNDKICMDGSECAVWMRYNGTCIETSNGGCI